MISIRNVSYSAGKTEIIKGLSADISPGEFTMILGPNGSGKSTFLKLFSGAILPSEGEIFYDNQNISVLKTAEMAKVRAVLSQRNELSFPLTVSEVIMMGRYPHFTFSPGKEDEDIVAEVMQLMNLKNFAQRNYLTLSGGEKQRVQFARVLAQIWRAPHDKIIYLFMDEPLTGLDINYQQEFLKIAVSLKNKNLVLVAVMHDINLAGQYADNLIFLKEGKLAAQGKPDDILSADLIEEVFNVKTSVIAHTVTGRPVMLYT